MINVLLSQVSRVVTTALKDSSWTSIVFARLKTSYLINCGNPLRHFFQSTAWIMTEQSWNFDAHCYVVALPSIFSDFFSFLLWCRQCLRNIFDFCQSTWLPKVCTTFRYYRFLSTCLNNLHEFCEFYTRKMCYRKVGSCIFNLPGVFESTIKYFLSCYYQLEIAVMAVKQSLMRPIGANQWTISVTAAAN